MTENKWTEHSIEEVRKYKEKSKEITKNKDVIN